MSIQIDEDIARAEAEGMVLRDEPASPPDRQPDSPVESEATS